MATGDPLGTRIAKRRHQLHLSQEELAALVGVSRDSVSKWERGKTEPTRHIGALEQVLGVRLDGVPDGQLDFDPDDPDEVRIVSWSDLPVIRRQAMIDELRAARLAARETA